MKKNRTTNTATTGKKTVRSYIVAAVLSVTALGLLGGCGGSDIGKDEATRIALEDAGFSESDVTRLYVSKDRDDGQSIYEVKFTGENTEYDYEVQASNGDIISCDMEEVKQNNTQTQQATDQQAQTDQNADSSQDGSQSGGQDNSQNGSPNNGQSAANSNVQITQDEAIKLALDRVPGATERDIRIELDYDDGYYKYEGDIIYNQKEYEFEIDANTGTFLEWSEERR